VIADPARVLAFRLAGQGLAAPVRDPFAALTGWAVQDSPPGAAALAMAARASGPVAGLLEAALADRTVVALYNARTATAVVSAAEVAAFATALAPDPGDDVAMAAVLGAAVPGRTTGLAEPAELAVEAISHALDGRTLSRDALHDELRRTLPEALLPWCARCRSHHARRGLLVHAGLRGRLCLAGRAGRQPAFARTDQWVTWSPPRSAADARAELVRRYLRAYGPSRPAHLAEWAGIAPAAARTMWALVAGELREVADETGAAAWLLEEDAARLARPLAARGVRLLGAGDPLLLGRDRASLIPDPALRRRAWPATGAPGVVLADGAVVGLWRARKAGRRLAVAVEPAGPVPREAVLEAAERLAPVRGCETASVAIGR
jgi:hypothetical protein